MKDYKQNIFSKFLSYSLWTVMFISLFLSACNAKSPEVINNDGNKAYEQKAYNDALIKYQEAQKGLSKSAPPFYNAANTYYRMQEYDRAGQEFTNALENASGDISEFSFYNLGNTLYQSNAFDQAIEAYKNALRLNPQDQDAKYNLELALQKKQEKQKEQQNQPKKEQNQERDDKSQEGQKENNNQNQPNPTQQVTPAQSSSEEGKTSQQEQTQQQPEPSGGLTEQQAKQLLESASQDTKSLQDYLQALQTSSQGEPSENW